MNTGGREACRLSVNDWEALEPLYLRWAGDPGWPTDARARSAWNRLVQTWQVGAWLGDAAVAVAKEGSEPVGYAALTLAVDHHPALGRAMEVGTFVAPTHRGTGVNRQLKRWSAEEAARFGAQWLAACIPVSNERAARAFLKAFPNAVAYEAADPSAGPWRDYVKQRAFASGEPVRLYVVPLHSDSHGT
ncbi:GNAT family N-acetyltransferase [Alicyclobacillus acidocaldarius]|uniref:GNAT family N-acetyltransferase n=1 Tax=Alicyclobacillus acidocaldarius TaxID=405212 RepID=UPI0002FCB683|nr:GNAT family N-acetyltransferase [Alicyclobacillus acidocaldarius]